MKNKVLIFGCLLTATLGLRAVDGYDFLKLTWWNRLFSNTNRVEYIIRELLDDCEEGSMIAHRFKEKYRGTGIEGDKLILRRMKSFSHSHDLEGDDFTICTSKKYSRNFFTVECKSEVPLELVNSEVLVEIEEGLKRMLKCRCLTECEQAELNYFGRRRYRESRKGGYGPRIRRVEV